MQRPLLSVHMMGGLGNQLFQIAAGYAYAQEHGYRLVLPKEWDHHPDRQPLWNGYLDIKQWNTITNEEYSRIPWALVAEEGFKFRPLSPPQYNNNYRLFGYFQSSLYFNTYKDTLCSLLRVPDSLLAKARVILDYIAVKNPDGWIGAHVRRGDYVQCADYHLVCSAEYYKGARAEICKTTGNRAVCWITDDTSWVRATLFQDGDKIISGDPLVDFAILSQFRYMILSNSSYSWWGAWLNTCDYKNRIICCPDKWFGPSGPQDYETVFERDWLRIDTTSGKRLAQD